MDAQENYLMIQAAHRVEPECISDKKLRFAHLAIRGFSVVEKYFTPDLGAIILKPI